MKGIVIHTDGDIRVDTSTDADGKLMGMALGVCDADIIERVLDAYPGDFKNAPLVGANVRGMIGGNANVFSRAVIIEQLKSQKIKINAVLVEDSENIQIDYDE